MQCELFAFSITYNLLTLNHSMKYSLRLFYWCDGGFGTFVHHILILHLKNLAFEQITIYNCILISTISNLYTEISLICEWVFGCKPFVTTSTQEKSCLNVDTPFVYCAQPSNVLHKIYVFRTYDTLRRLCCYC